MLEREHYHELGEYLFGGTVSVTDPCRDCGAWFRLDDVMIVPGPYTGYVGVKDVSGLRVHDLVIVHRDRSLDEVIDRDMKGIAYVLGEICVDAGLAGIFEDKPDFTNEEWGDFWSGLDEIPGTGITSSECDFGFCAEPGPGDGFYPVYGYDFGNGRYEALCIEFIVPEDAEWR